MIRLLFSFTLIAVLTVGCGSRDSGTAYTCSSSATTASSALATAIPTIGISSVTASCTGSTASRTVKGSRFAQAFDAVQASFASFFKTFVFEFAKSSTKATAATLQNSVEAANDIVEVLDATSAAACTAGVGNLVPTTSVVSCYGPQLYYEGHPDGSPSTGNLPTGDLGLWTSAEASGEACSAAKANAVVQNVADSVNSGLRMAAAVACLLRVNGQTLPTSGTSNNMASAWNAAGNVSGLSITTATIAFVSANTYTTTISGTKSGQNFSVTLTHTETDATTSSGRIYGTFDNAGTVGFSVVYSQVGNTLTALAKSGQGNSFDGSNNYDFSGFTGNGYYNLISVDTTTGLGTMYSAWQAGSGDSHTRVFRANTSRNASGSDVGFAYFGYGPKLTESGTGGINRMICNWAGPSNDHTGLANKAQGQVLARNAAGIFASAGDYITYAPTNSCDNSSATFNVGTTSGSLSALGTVTNNLVALDALGTIPTLTEPTY